MTASFEDPRVAQLGDPRLEEYLTLSPSELETSKQALLLCEPWVESCLGPDRIMHITRGYKSYVPRVETTAKYMSIIAKWRRDENIDSILHTQLAGLEDFDRCWPGYIYGRDKHGHTVFAEKLSDLRLERICSDFTEQQLVQFRVQQLEYLTEVKRRTTRALGRTVYQHIHILDVAGLEWSQFTSEVRVLIPKVLSVAETYYPQALFTLYVTNAPFIFRAIWSIIKMGLHPLTQQKIQIHGGNPKKQMIKEGIPIESIPEWLGGKSDGNTYLHELKRLQDERKAEQQAERKAKQQAERKAEQQAEVKAAQRPEGAQAAAPASSTARMASTLDSSMLSLWLDGPDAANVKPAEALPSAGSGGWGMRLLHKPPTAAAVTGAEVVKRPSSVAQHASSGSMPETTAGDIANAPKDPLQKTETESGQSADCHELQSASQDTDARAPTCNRDDREESRTLSADARAAMLGVAARNMLLRLHTLVCAILVQFVAALKCIAMKKHTEQL
ncbi:hypothetical protein CYMTET_49976 [Cymbomonas tetramitiformis]|uniref:CRAL-TRIO domain-containing protein n=1 Tax=Cymbomonas tetramitiformis TaxID=36881 RepID=A0AAE0BQC2_9CHLO|nr:hypothetical protein CYMTET_49976 [Cymbomonas tetramitiformis]